MSKILLFALVFVVLFLLYRRFSGQAYQGLPAAELKALTDRLNQRRHTLLEEIEHVDGYADLIADPPDATLMRERRESAIRKYEEAVNILDRAKTSRDLDRVSMLFDETRADLTICREVIDRLTGAEAPPSTEETEQPTPEDRCHYCGSQAHEQATVTTDGARQKVWVCSNCLNEIRDGRTPTMRA